MFSSFFGPFLHQSDGLSQSQPPLKAIHAHAALLAKAVMPIATQSSPIDGSPTGARKNMEEHVKTCENTWVCVFKRGRPPNSTP